jgi:hypothetical protein
MMNEYPVLIGACGWEHDAWNGGFYPEDLPADWRLGYYGNEFPVVLIPAIKWPDDVERVQEWLAETDESPAFVAEWPVNSNHDQAQRVCEYLDLLGDRVLGICLPIMNDSSWFEQLTWFCEHKGAVQKLPVSLDADHEIAEEILATCQEKWPERSWSLCWHGEVGIEANLKSGEFAVARINSTSESANLTPKALRVHVEACLAAQTEQRTVILLYDGNPPSLEAMNNAGLILDML